MQRPQPSKRPVTNRPMPTKRPITNPADSEDDDESMEENEVVEQMDEKRPYASKRPIHAGKRPIHAGKRPLANHSESSDDDSEDIEERQVKKRTLDSSESETEEDSDSEEEEEEEEEEDTTNKKKVIRNKYIEEEADVDEDEDDEDFTDEEPDGFIEHGEAAEAEALKNDISYRELDKRREMVEEEEDVSQRIAQLKQRFGRGYGEYKGDTDIVPIQLLLPTAKDPNLWLVKCRPGKEQEIALSLMRKSLEYAQSEFPLPIKSVVVRESLKGYIYIEARSMGDVQTAIDKVNNVYGQKIIVIPLEERVDVLTVRKKTNSLKVGSWVRLTRGKYKGDLAQVLEVYENQESLRVKFIPRIDYTPKSQKPNEGKRRAFRPNQNLFNIKDVDLTDRKGITRKAGGVWMWGNDLFDRFGFLEKDIKVSALMTENVVPRLEEVSAFTNAMSSNNEEDSNGIDLTSLTQATANIQNSKGPSFEPGDLVTITSGEMLNATGTIVSISALANPPTALLKMTDEVFGTIEVELSTISRSFRVGDHVKVSRGKFENEQGLITQVNDNTAVVFSDKGMNQFTVFLKDLQSVGEVSLTENTASTYQLHDFIQIGPANIGVIIKVETNQYKIIDQNGAVRYIKPTEISQKRDSKNAVASDVDRHPLQAGDAVEIIAGEHQKKHATILHLDRIYVFCLLQELVETSGVFVVRSSMVRIAGAKRQLMTQMDPVKSGFQGAGRGRRDPSIHKTAVIIGGPFKGYRGIVKNANDTQMTIELNTNGKMISVDRTKVQIQGQSDGGFRAPPDHRGGKTPSWNTGGKTPAWDSGSKTPAWNAGGKTPAWDASAKTPAWNAGSKTPAWNTGGKTPQWNTGGKTPAWDASAKTPAWDANAKTPAWDSGSKTPAWNAGGKTPQWNAESSRTANTWESARPSSTAAAASTSAQDCKYTYLFLAWLGANMKVRFKSGALTNQLGFVLNATPDGSQGTIAVDNPNVPAVTVSAVHLDPVRPDKKDRCVFISGNFRGQTGKMIGMDGNEVIVQLDSHNDFQVTSMNSLCKLVTQ